MSKLIYILNGPNLNLLGQREPEIYGTTTLADIETMATARAKAHGLTVSFHQSNHEGELVDLCHEAREKAAGLIVNLGAFTHTSIAIFDALSAVEKPIIEVHLSNIYARESFRHKSYVSPLAQGVICGLGAQGYELAMDGMAQILSA